MAATKEDVENWVKEAKEKGCKYIISVCDTFSYDDYPVYIHSEEDLETAKIKYSQNMQRINEIIFIHLEKKPEIIKDSIEETVEITGIYGILEAIKENKIEVGMNKSYCFVFDEYKELVFLKRSNTKIVFNEQWPKNKYDGKVLWKSNLYSEGAVDIIESIFQFLNIDYLA